MYHSKMINNKYKNMTISLQLFEKSNMTKAEENL